MRTHATLDVAAAVLLLALTAVPAAAQEKQTEHTLKLAGAKPEAATVQDMTFLAGRWVGEALGGESEEVWTPPRGGVMLGMYRLVRDGKPIFYELFTLSEHEGSLIIRLKHFNADMTGWEEKNDVKTFRYVGRRGRVVHFEGLAFEPDGDALRVYLAIGQKDGGVKEETFRYRRVPLTD